MRLPTILAWAAIHLSRNSELEKAVLNSIKLATNHLDAELHGREINWEGYRGCIERAKEKLPECDTLFKPYLQRRINDVQSDAKEIRTPKRYDPIQ